MNVASRSFAGGEVSASLYARTDVARYSSALRTCRNFICLKHGGATNRAGTSLVTLALGGTVATLEPFVFNDAQSYALLFTANVLRIVQSGGLLAVTVATPYLDTELRALQFTQSADVLTIVHPSHPIMELRRLAALSWTLTPVVFGPSIAAPGGLTLAPSG